MFTTPIIGRRFAKVLVILSGGQDSTTCLFWAKTIADEVHAVTFDYGQRHQRELAAAAIVAGMAGVASHEEVTLGPILQGTSPLVNKLHQVEGYANADVLPGGIEKTFVPMRNALFLTIAANRAAVLGCSMMITGVSQEDYGGYPDCREEFLNAQEQAINMALGESHPDYLHIGAPLLYLDKQRTVYLAQEVPGALRAMANTHTCYRGEYPPCGTCHACLLREKGFAQAGIPDPLVTAGSVLQVPGTP